MVSGERWRLVTEQNGREPSVSSVVLAADEVQEQLDGEAAMHAYAGWVVTVGDDVIVCRKVRGPNVGLVRVIRAIAFDPMHDSAGVS